MDILIKDLEIAIQRSVPLVSISTEDQYHVIRRITDMIDNAEDPKLKKRGLILWNCVDGLDALNDRGKAALNEVRQSLIEYEGMPAEQKRFGQDFSTMLLAIRCYLPQQNIVISMNI